MVSDFEEMLMWTSYRYAIGRKTYVSCLAHEIPQHYYEKLSKEKGGLTGRMNNKNFVDNAPATVLEQTKARIEELTVEENTIKELIESLKA